MLNFLLPITVSSRLSSQPDPSFPRSYTYVSLATTLNQQTYSHTRSASACYSRKCGTTVSFLLVAFWKARRYRWGAVAWLNTRGVAFYSRLRPRCARWTPRREESVDFPRKKNTPSSACSTVRFVSARQVSATQSVFILAEIPQLDARSLSRAGASRWEAIVSPPAIMLFLSCIKENSPGRTSRNLSAPVGEYGAHRLYFD